MAQTMEGARMTDAALLRLMTWLSPSFPVGAFSYSHGLEYAVEAGMVADADALAAWLEDILVHGTGRADGVLFAASWRACKAGDDGAWRDVAGMGAAFAPSAELAMETRNQGAAFLKAVRDTWPTETMRRLENTVDRPIVYPVAVGAACAAHNIALRCGLAAYLHGVMANIVSAGLRLIPLGQTEGLRVMKGLETRILAQAEAMAGTSLEDLASSTPLADICSMRHETQTTRLFRS